MVRSKVLKDGTTWNSTRGARELPGIVVYRWEVRFSSPIAPPFGLKLLLIAADRHPSWVVVQCEAVTDIDVSAGQMLKRHPYREAERLGHAYGIRGDAQPPPRTSERYGLLDTLDGNLAPHPTLEAGLAAIREGADVGPPHFIPVAVDSRSDRRQR